MSEKIRIGRRGVAGSGSGDMQVSVYDTNNDGIVNSSDYSTSTGNADTLDGHHSSFFSSTGHNHELSSLSDVDDAGRSNNRTLVWDSLNNKHVYADMGTVVPVGGTINRVEGVLSSIDLESGITISIVRDGNGSISQVDNETYTWSFNRDGDGNIISWTVA